MQILKEELDSSKILFFSCLVFIVGLFTAETIKVIPTIGLSGMLLSIVISYKDRQFKIHNPNSRIVLSLCGVFFFYLIAFLRKDLSVSSLYWAERTLVKIPFLILPICAVSVNQLSSKYVARLYSVFFYLVLITAFGSTINYVFNYEEVNKLITSSKNLPVIINHVRYSLYVAFAVFLGWYLQQYRQDDLSFRFEKYVLRYGAIFLMVFLHIAAVRSGLVIFYGLTGLLIIYQLFIKNQQYKQGSFLMMLLIVLPFVFYLSSQSLKNKVANMITDLESVDNQERADEYSLSGRWFSYRVGYDIYSEGIWRGVGIANLKSEINDTYSENFPLINRAKFEPHNQFLFWLSSSGIIGLIILLVLFLLPMFYMRYKDFYHFGVIHYALVLVSFMVENTIETQIGANFTIFFCVLPFFANGRRNEQY